MIEKERVGLMSDDIVVYFNVMNATNDAVYLKISQKNLGRCNLIMRIITPALYGIGVIDSTGEIGSTRDVFK